MSLNKWGKDIIVLHHEQNTYQSFHTSSLWHSLPSLRKIRLFFFLIVFYQLKWVQLSDLKKLFLIFQESVSSSSLAALLTDSTSVWLSEFSSVIGCIGLRHTWRNKTQQQADCSPSRLHSVKQNTVLWQFFNSTLTMSNETKISYNIVTLY